MARSRLFALIRHWRSAGSARRAAVSRSEWQPTFAQWPSLRHLGRDEQYRLGRLSTRFLRHKTFAGGRDWPLSAEIERLIAAQACLPILNLGLEYYRGWREIVVYQDSFLVKQTERDAAGVVHEQQRALGGEAWDTGPVILSWNDARPGARPHGEASNVILHELAHKLDMLNGRANGMPPLHPGMVRQDWTNIFSGAYEDLGQRLAYREPSPIDPYAAENPAEFFAVVTEYFFEAPRTLTRHYPEVYRQLRLFFRQDPVSWPQPGKPAIGSDSRSH